MNKRHLKEKLNNRETVIGTWNIIPSSTIVEAIGYSGFDFVVIDAEHGPINMETAENLIRAAEVAGTTPIVRVPTNESYLVLRALDIGAHGVQVPHVSTKEEAERVVKYSKYYPKGERGFSPFTRAGKYGLEAYTHAYQSNENTMIIINIEGKEGIKNLEEIATVRDIDIIFIGPYDLSQSLGKPGQVSDPDVLDLIKQSAMILRGKGLACGSFAKDMKYLEILIDCGVQYITYMVDSAVISSTYKHIYDSFLEIKRGLNK